MGFIETPRRERDKDRQATTIQLTYEAAVTALHSLVGQEVRVAMVEDGPVDGLCVWYVRLTAVRESIADEVRQVEFGKDDRYVGWFRLDDRRDYECAAEELSPEDREVHGLAFAAVSFERDDGLWIEVRLFG